MLPPHVGGTRRGIAGIAFASGDGGGAVVTLGLRPVQRLRWRLLAASSAPHFCRLLVNTTAVKMSQHPFVVSDERAVQHLSPTFARFLLLTTSACQRRPTWSCALSQIFNKALWILLMLYNLAHGSKSARIRCLFLKHCLTKLFNCSYVVSGYTHEGGWRRLAELGR